MGSHNSTSILKSTFNTRYVPTGDKRYLRSDCPSELTDEEVKWLKDNNYITVVDFRNPEECELKPCRLEHEEGFTYLHMPFTGEWYVPNPPTLEQIIKSYEEMVNDNTFKIVDTIMNAPTRVLYFCAAGKDRTGIVSAIILYRLGFDEETIIKDYMESRNNSLAYVKAYMEKYHPNEDIKPVLSDERYLKAALKLVKQREHKK